jgi:hypothetical protein
MDISKKYLHDRVVLVLITLITIFLVIGVGIVLLRFDVAKNPTTIVAYRPNITGASYQSGKPIDIYSMAAFMILTAVGGVLTSARIYHIRKYLSVFILGSSVFLLILATIVANALISLQ